MTTHDDSRNDMTPLEEMGLLAAALCGLAWVISREVFLAAGRREVVAWAICGVALIAATAIAVVAAS